MGQNPTNPKGIIPEPFWCDHSNPNEIAEVYKEGSSYPNYYKCRICGSEFPTLGDTDYWEPVMVDYDKQS